MMKCVSLNSIEAASNNSKLFAWFFIQLSYFTFYKNTYIDASHFLNDEYIEIIKIFQRIIL